MKKASYIGPLTIVIPLAAQAGDPGVASGPYNPGDDNTLSKRNNFFQEEEEFDSNPWE